MVPHLSIFSSISVDPTHSRKSLLVLCVFAMLTPTFVQKLAFTICFCVVDPTRPRKSLVLPCVFFVILPRTCMQKLTFTMCVGYVDAHVRAKACFNYMLLTFERPHSCKSFLLLCVLVIVSPTFILCVLVILATTFVQKVAFTICFRHFNDHVRAKGCFYYVCWSF